MGRSIFAVVAGFVLTFVLNLATGMVLARVAPQMEPGPGQSSAGMLVVGVTVAVYGILGCYVTARLAPSRPMFHALVMGGIALVMLIPLTIQAWNDAPAWYNIYNLLAVMVYAWIGGRIRERQLQAAGSARLASA